jgi:hypothetical protein
MSIRITCPSCAATLLAPRKLLAGEATWKGILLGEVRRERPATDLEVKWNPSPAGWEWSYASVEPG